MLKKVWVMAKLTATAKRRGDKAQNDEIWAFDLAQKPLFAPTRKRPPAEP